MRVARHVFTCLQGPIEMLKRWGGEVENLSNNKTMCTIYLIPLSEYDNEHDQHIEHHEDLV
jgi:hypothetical protein